MKNLSVFQMAVLGGSIFVAVLGVVVFALFGGAFKSSAGTVVIWGTLDQPSMITVLNALRQGDKSFEQVSYEAKDPTTFQSDLINAIASGNPPDLFLMTQEDITQLQNKVQILPYSSISQNTFLSSYIDEGQLFLTPQGTMGLPFAVDPMVMYWNRDLLASAGVPLPPTYWSDLVADAPLITKLDASSNIKQSAVALGLWSNVDHVKELLTTILMQAGDPITTQKNGVLTPVFGTSGGVSGASQLPAESAVRFYTDFADPAKSVYSWNRSLPRSRDAFVSGSSAIYFGFMSEYQSLRAGNPNLHIGVALLPQVQGQQTIATYGRLYTLAIPRAAANPLGAFSIAQKLTNTTGAALVATNIGLPSGRRDLPIDTSADAVAQIALRSALIARGWIDPSPGATTKIFQTMIESVVSGARSPVDAVGAASQALQSVFVQLPQ